MNARVEIDAAARAARIEGDRHCEQIAAAGAAENFVRAHEIGRLGPALVLQLTAWRALLRRTRRLRTLRPARPPFVLISTLTVFTIAHLADRINFRSSNHNEPPTASVGPRQRSGLVVIRRDAPLILSPQIAKAIAKCRRQSGVDLGGDQADRTQILQMHPTPQAKARQLHLHQVGDSHQQDALGRLHRRRERRHRFVIMKSPSRAIATEASAHAGNRRGDSPRQLAASACRGRAFCRSSGSERSGRASRAASASPSTPAPAG